MTEYTRIDRLRNSDFFGMRPRRDISTKRKMSIAAEGNFMRKIFAQTLLTIFFALNGQPASVLVLTQLKTGDANP